MNYFFSKIHHPLFLNKKKTRFSEDIEFMIGHKPNIFWKVAWKFLAPLFMMALLLGTLIQMFSSPITYKAYNSVTVCHFISCFFVFQLSYTRKSV